MVPVRKPNFPGIHRLLFAEGYDFVIQRFMIELILRRKIGIEDGRVIVDFTKRGGGG